MLLFIKSVWKLSRPLNSGMAAIGTALGFWLSGNQSGVIALLLLSMASATALCFGNIINDLFDVEGDKINHPERPLPAGMISINTTKYVAAIFFITPPLLGLLVSPVYSLATIIPLLLLIIYTVKLKGTPLIGNLMVSFLTAYTLYFGGLTGPLVNSLFYPALLAFILSVIREIIKDMEDYEGDAKTGARTTAVLPFKVIKSIIYLCVFFYVLILPFPYLTGSFGFTYLMIAGGVIFPVHLIAFILITKAHLKKQFSLLSKIIKLEMVMGLIAMAVDFYLNK